MADYSTDTDLIRRVCSGEKEAYAELIQRHHPRILGLCLSLLQDPSLAEDAAQETFLKAYRSLKKFRAASLFSTWLTRIASNHCLDLLRKRAQEKTESLETLLEREGDQIQHLFSKPDASMPAENTDLLDRVLSHLSPEHRLILTLREVQGLNYKDLAEALDCSLDAVKGRLKRARQNLEEIVRHFLRPDHV